jgi:hypothetical protein
MSVLHTEMVAVTLAADAVVLPHSSSCLSNLALLTTHSSRDSASINSAYCQGGKKQFEWLRLLKSAEGNGDAGAPSDQNTAAKAVWKQIQDRMKPPLCKGHGEPCVIRQVKKGGANQGKPLLSHHAPCPFLVVVAALECILVPFVLHLVRDCCPRMTGRMLLNGIHSHAGFLGGSEMHADPQQHGKR